MVKEEQDMTSFLNILFMGYIDSDFIKENIFPQMRRYIYENEVNVFWEKEEANKNILYSNINKYINTYKLFISNINIIKCSVTIKRKMSNFS